MSLAVETEKGKHLTEPIFDLNAPQVALDEEKVKFSIYNEINPGKKKTKEKEEWSLRMACISEWFIRCSWINKFIFLDVLCYKTEGCVVLENVLKAIDSILSKDVLESLSNEATNFCFDRIPADDNRALESDELNKAMKNAFVWYLNLDARHQVRVILKLLRLGAGGLVFMIYKSAEKYYKERQEVYSLLLTFPSASLGATEESKQKIRFSSKSKMPTQNSPDGKSLDSENVESMKLSEFANKKQQQLERRNTELRNYKKLKGLLEDDSKKKKGEVKETVDYLQILPISLSRRILSYIDDKALAEFKKVGKYWSKMIDESINEKSGKKAIIAKINKIVGISPDKGEKKKEEEEEEEEKEEEVEFIVEMGPKYFINKKNENEATLISMTKTFERLFSKKSVITSLDTVFCPGRCGVYDSRIPAIVGSSSNNIIHFYSPRTGARLNFMIFGLESPATCLNFHENKTHVFIGCKDGSLISKDFRTNKTGLIFNGHLNAVLSIFTTPSTLLSSSLDNTVKYFRLWSGVCLLCIDLNPGLNISSLLLRSNNPSWAAIGTLEGILITVDVELKRFLSKIKLHTNRITQLAQDGDFLITGSANGKIRIWNMNQLESNCIILSPYYNIDVGSSVSALKYYKNQIFCGCENGTLKIISLATGKVFKTLVISPQTPITGVDITEDKLFMKLIIWHEKGIEIRTFSLQKSSSKKISKERDNQESKQKAPKETKKNKTSEMVFSDYVKTSQIIIENTTSPDRRTVFSGLKMPIQQRCCTLSLLRMEHRKIWEFNSSLFTEVYNMSHLEPQNFSLNTFPRLNNINSKNIQQLSKKKQKR